MFTQKHYSKYLERTEEIGFIEEIVNSIVYVSGLPGGMLHELVIFETGGFGEVIGLKENFLEVLVFSDPTTVKVGFKATRTGKMFEVPVGNELVGRAIDPLGLPLDGKPKIDYKEFRAVDVPAPGIDARARIKKTMQTGVTVIDMLLPVGKGQRELVIGDRKSGKTNFLLRSMLAQAKQGTICIYAGIGKKKLDIKKVEEFFYKNQIVDKTLIVASNPEDPSGVIFLTPYAAMVMAEFFKDQGKDVLLVLDDLSTHAKFYREIALLGRRFPGRNSYPGDIFYTHAKLLERAGNFLTQKQEASITCLPVVETSQGDLSGYIQTNIMSMTDGHLYFDSDLFAKGRRPAVNPFLSVTRVGHQTQTALRREINRELLSFLTLYEKMQSFMHFGAELNDNIRSTIETGERIINFFTHTADNIVPENVQTFLFSLLWKGFWDGAEKELMEEDMLQIVRHYESSEKVKSAIDKLMMSSDSFNSLLGKVEGDRVFLKKIGIDLTALPKKDKSDAKTINNQEETKEKPEGQNEEPVSSSKENLKTEKHSFLETIEEALHLKKKESQKQVELKEPVQLEKKGVYGRGGKKIKNDQ